MNINEEKILRENIREMIRFVKQKKTKQVELEEQQLRGIIQQFIEIEERLMLQEGGLPDDKPTPNKSTGINVLEDLLKKIIPVLEIDFRQLTTNTEQRASFRAHIVNAVVSTLTPVETNTKAGDEEAELEGGEGEEIEIEDEEVEEIEEAIDIDIASDDEEKFIDIRTDAEKKTEEEAEAPDPKEEFGAGIEGEDETGRNMAYQSFNKIEGNIIDAYELLSNAEDQELFYDYLIANLKLYFDKFEGELSTTIEEPTNQAYEDAAAEDAEMGADIEGGEELGELPPEGEEELAPEGEELPPLEGEEELPPLEEDVIVWDI